MSRLVLCPACARHLRASESTCPFCAAELGAPAAPSFERSAVAAATSRAAILFLGAVAATGCGDSKSPAETPTSGPTTLAIPPYGVPMPDPTQRPPEGQPDPQARPTNTATDPSRPSGPTPATSSSAQGATGEKQPKAQPSTLAPPVRIVPPYGVPPIPTQPPPEKK